MGFLVGLCSVTEFLLAPHRGYRWTKRGRWWFWIQCLGTAICTYYLVVDTPEIAMAMGWLFLWMVLVFVPFAWLVVADVVGPMLYCRNLGWIEHCHQE